MIEENKISFKNSHISKNKISIFNLLKSLSYKKICIHLALIVGSIIILLPFFWMVSTSLKSGANTFNCRWIPRAPQWSNYKRVLFNLPFPKYMLNSALLSFINIVGHVISCSLAGYAFSNQKFKYKKQLFLILLGTMMIPNEVLFFPQFILFNKLGWYGTLKPLWVPSFLGNAFFIFLMRQFFLTIPTELSEAAKIDGCSSFRIFWNIYLPLSKPAIATVAIYTFVGVWNAFFGPLIYITKDTYRTASLALYYLKNSYEGVSSLPISMTASILTVIPVLVIYYLGQRYFVKGIVFKGVDK